MSPETPEGRRDARIGKLETAMARQEQRTDDLAIDVRALMPLVIIVSELRGVVEHSQREQQREIQDCASKVGELRRKMDEREAERIKKEEKAAEKEEKAAEERRKRREQDAADARNSRRALLVGMVLVVLTTLGGLIVQLVLSA